MEGSRRQLFARPGFSGDEDRGVGPRDHRDFSNDVLDRLTLSDNMLERVHGRGGFNAIHGGKRELALQASPAVMRQTVVDRDRHRSRKLSQKRKKRFRVQPFFPPREDQHADCPISDNQRKGAVRLDPRLAAVLITIGERTQIVDGLREERLLVFDNPGADRSLSGKHLRRMTPGLSLFQLHEIHEQILIVGAGQHDGHTTESQHRRRRSRNGFKQFIVIEMSGHSPVNLRDGEMFFLFAAQFSQESGDRRLQTRGIGDRCPVSRATNSLFAHTDSPQACSIDRWKLTGVRVERTRSNSGRFRFQQER